MAEAWAGFSQEELRRLRGQRPGTDRAAPGAPGERGQRGRERRGGRPWASARRQPPQLHLPPTAPQHPISAAAPPTVLSFPSAPPSASLSLLSAAPSTPVSLPSAHLSTFLTLPSAPPFTPLSLSPAPTPLCPSPQLSRSIPASNACPFPGSPSLAPGSPWVPPIQPHLSLLSSSSPSVHPQLLRQKSQPLQPLVLHPHLCPIPHSCFQAPFCLRVTSFFPILHFITSVCPPGWQGPFLSPRSASP